ncbi:MAG: hypothetical protein JW804_07615, partial [Sedimentisphaerales bacterium]|nr:hypothetical protein [Sedimentisphaerales bacterium]
QIFFEKREILLLDLEFFIGGCFLCKTNPIIADFASKTTISKKYEPNSNPFFTRFRRAKPIQTQNLQA